MRILQYPHPILSQKAQPLDLSDRSTHSLAIELAVEMRKVVEMGYEGKVCVGLAAPQVGESIALIVVKHGDHIITLVNPQITWHSEAMHVDEESCLSLKGTVNKFNVSRWNGVTVEAQNLDGSKHKIKRAGHFFGRILQHEIDHLQGITILDRSREQNAQ